MAFRRDSSPQTRAVLTGLLASQAGWQHGYDLAQRAALASGTLYPILGRLAGRGLLETRWEDDPPEGRPRRHLYRLTADGAALAVAVTEEDEAARQAQRQAQQRTGGRMRRAGGHA